MIRSQQLPAAWRMDEADSKPAGNSKFRRLFLTRQIRAGARTIGFSALTFFSVGCLPAMAEPNGLTVELNKLESQGSGCRAYMVVQNDSDTSYKAFKLDLVLFQSDGVIGRRFAMDLAPLKAKKRTVKLFDLDNTPCDKIGSFLINDVVECTAEAGPVENCLAGVTVKSLTDAELQK